MKNSSGYEGISIKIIKMCSPFIRDHLSFICNMSIMSCVFPDCLKNAVVEPLYKKGDKSDITNYRPICMLTSFSKVLEKTMYHRLNQHLSVNNVLVFVKICQPNMQLTYLSVKFIKQGMINFKLLVYSVILLKRLIASTTRFRYQIWSIMGFMI
jgi:hypothetical protein